MGAGQSHESTKVLIVDDDESVVKMYSEWVGREHDTVTAVSGQEAIRKVDETIDVILLDRRMPGMTGDETLERIRSRGFDCPVAMITAVNPTGDIVEMPFDRYLKKPIRGEELLETVEQLQKIESLDERDRESVRQVEKKNTLEEENLDIEVDVELDESGSYEEISDQMTDLQNDIDSMVDELSTRSDSERADST